MRALSQIRWPTWFVRAARLSALDRDIGQALAQRRSERRPPRGERKRFDRARPMVDRLRAEMAEARVA